MTTPGAARREPRTRTDARDPHRHLRRHLPLHRLQEHRRRRSLGGRARSRESTGPGGARPWPSPSRTFRVPAKSGRSDSAGSSARRTRASSAARAPTWMTSACPGCCTARSCAAPTRTPGSSRSTPRRRWRCPGVAAVVTAKDLETLGLAWMPTISYDTQAVLAGDKVRFQGQEVAFVIATDEYIARDALRADRRRVRAAAGRRRRAQGAGSRRAADPRRQGGPGRQPGLADVGGRRRGGHRPRVRRGRRDRQARHHLPALPPGAAGDVRDDRRLQPPDRPAGHLQRQPGAQRAPHGLRARGRAWPST